MFTIKIMKLGKFSVACSSLPEIHPWERSNKKLVPEIKVQDDGWNYVCTFEKRCSTVIGRPYMVAQSAQCVLLTSGTSFLLERSQGYISGSEEQATENFPGFPRMERFLLHKKSLEKIQSALFVAILWETTKMLPKAQENEIVFRYSVVELHVFILFYDYFFMFFFVYFDCVVKILHKKQVLSL